MINIIKTKKLINLIKKAKNASQYSYSPYSNFKVGCAFINTNGEVFVGTNVENSSFGLSICAERNAIFNSILSGEQIIDTLVIYTPTNIPTAPCGACRQVINEFSKDDTLIISICDNNTNIIQQTISELLPYSFGKGNLS